MCAMRVTGANKLSLYGSNAREAYKSRPEADKALALIRSTQKHTTLKWVFHQET